MYYYNFIFHPHKKTPKISVMNGVHFNLGEGEEGACILLLLPFQKSPIFEFLGGHLLNQQVFFSDRNQLLRMLLHSLTHTLHYLRSTNVNTVFLLKKNWSTGFLFWDH